jgi:hypothetical protein
MMTPNFSIESNKKPLTGISSIVFRESQICKEIRTLSSAKRISRVGDAA